MVIRAALGTPTALTSGLSHSRTGKTGVSECGCRGSQRKGEGRRGEGRNRVSPAIYTLPCLSLEQADSAGSSSAPPSFLPVLWRERGP